MAPKIWFYTLTSVFLVSLISLIGVFTLSLNKKKLQKILLLLVSFAVGALFGDAFIHLLPKSFEKLGMGLNTSLLILLGIFLFLILEKFLRWRHCHTVTSEKHPHPIATINLVGDGLHNLVDGMLIGASYHISTPVGIATTLAVILHEIPQEIGDFGVLVQQGLSVKKALFFNLLSASLAIFGAFLSLLIGAFENYYLFLLPITAGGFIYIAGSDLIPELQHRCKISTSFWQIIFILAGAGIMALLTLLE